MKSLQAGQHAVKVYLAASQAKKLTEVSCGSCLTKVYNSCCGACLAWSYSFYKRGSISLHSGQVASLCWQVHPLPDIEDLPLLASVHGTAYAWLYAAVPRKALVGAESDEVYKARSWLIWREGWVA